MSTPAPPDLIKYVKKRRELKKVVILGPTGSGKTSFLEGFFGDFVRSDVKRRPDVENAVDTGYIRLKSNAVPSLTTISMNQLSVMLLVTRANQLVYKSAAERTAVEKEKESYDNIVNIAFIDNPGQERFQFVAEATIRGADATIIMLDGTSSASISSLPKFVEMINEEIRRTGNDIPILVCVNKLDLADQNLYLGSDEVLQMLGDLIKKYQIVLFETSNKNFATFEVALRTLMNVLPS